MEGGVALQRMPGPGHYTFTPGNTSQPPPNFTSTPRPPFQPHHAQPGGTFQPPGPGGKRFIGPDLCFDGKRMRKAVSRKTVDYNTSVVNYLEVY